MDSCQNGKMKLRCKLLLSLALTLGLLLPTLSRAADETIVPKGTLITLQLNKNLSTKRNNEGDPFTAVVMTPVYQDDQIVIPKGSTVTGSISRITRPSDVFRSG